MSFFRKSAWKRVAALLLGLVVLFTAVPTGGGAVVWAETGAENGSDTGTGEQAVLLPDDSFGFQETEPQITYAPDATYDSSAILTPGAGTGAVTYSIEAQTDLDGAPVTDDVAALDQNTGMLTVARSGKVTVKAEKASDGTYEEASNSYTLTVSKAAQPDFAFSSGPAEVSLETGTYTRTAMGSLTNDVTYSIPNADEQQYAEIDAASGMLSLKAPGTVNVQAVSNGDDCYESASASYAVKILPKTQSGFGFVDADGNAEGETTYQEDQLTYTLPIPQGGEGDGAVTYYIDSQEDPDGNPVTAGTNDIALIQDASIGELAIQRAGKVIVRAEKAASGAYGAAEAFYTLTIKKGAQPDVTFTEPNPGEIEWGSGSYTNELLNSKTGNVTYTITSGTEFAEVDPAKGKLTFKAAGRVTVSAVSNGNDCYEPSAPVDYTVTILRKPQTLSFTDGEDVSLKYGKVSYVNSLQDAGEGSGAVTYELKDAAVGEGIVKGFAADTGTITFNDGVVGSVTVVARKAADDCYAEASAEYTLTLTYTDTPEPAYILKGDQKNGSGWYTGAVMVKAPDGYTISTSNKLENNKWETEVMLEANGIYSGIQVYLKNASGEITDAVTLEEIRIDQAVPVMQKITYTQNLIEKVLETVTFGLYDGSELGVTIVADDSASGSGIAALKYAYLSDGEVAGSNHQKKWMEIPVAGNPDVVVDQASGTATYRFQIPAEFHGDVQITAVDTAGNEAVEQSDGRTIVVDNKNPDVKIRLLDEDQKEITDTTIPVGGTVTAEITIEESNFMPDQTRATVGGSERAFDNAWSRWSDETGAKTDKWINTITFTADGEYQLQVTSADLLDKEGSAKQSFEIDRTAPTGEILPAEPKVKSDDGIAWYYDTDIKEEKLVTLRITEKNFVGQNVTVKVNGVPYALTEEWKNTGENIWENTVSIIGDGNYKISMDCVDEAGNPMQPYELPHTLVIDKTSPQVQTEFLDTAGDKTEPVLNDGYFNRDVRVGVTITDPSLAPDKTVTVKNGVVETVVWEQKAADCWYAEIPFTGDDNATLEVTALDVLGHEQSVNKEFCVDKTAPGAEHMTISYSKELKQWEKIVNSVTLGYYYAHTKTVDVTVEARDALSGIDHFTWTYTKEDGASAVNVPEKTETIPKEKIQYGADGYATAEFSLTASEYEQYRGSITVVATDRAGNSSEKKDNGNIHIVDTIAPKRTVTYTDARQVVDADTLRTMAEYRYDSENTNAILYYDDDVTATFLIEEANFYADDVVIKVNGERQKVDHWKQNGDLWSASIILKNEGDYIVSMSYKDRSGNEMTEYQSEKIVIDRTAPVIDISYGNRNVQNEIEGIRYFNAMQTAQIAVTEHNFRADDMIVTVSAKDADKNDVTVSDYASYLSNRSNWEKNGDVHTANITFPTDANYEFDIAYKDLAQNEASDYEKDLFTVDKTAPENLELRYSESVLEEVLEGVTFGFYEAQMTVTVTAQDMTSGVHEIMYSALKADGVSDVNTEIIGEVIGEGALRLEGSSATAEIRVPAGELAEGSQFDGTITCEASDRSKNRKELKDDQRIVVDNIAPVINVTFDEPVREANEISYYAGDLEVRMEVNEANFYPEDVKVNVTRDGADIAVSPEWQDESADIHVGTFTLREDGDYFITVDYTDKSSNEMEQYTSEQLTIDTEDPTISVSEIWANEASREDVYGFTVTADDTNLDAESFTPVLTAVVQTESGVFETKEMSLGAMRTVEAGKTYAYTVSNLPEDAIYTLSCTVTDMADHEYALMRLEDGNDYDSVQFSVNREGSTFLLSDDTSDLVEQYYVYSPSEDVVIREINVDPVETYTVRLNGEVLLEDRDYDTTISGGGDSWSERVYRIDKEMFEEEGEYSVSIESTDKTDTVSYSDVKNAAVTFVVDQSAPIVSISGLESGGRYETDEQTVTVLPTDEGGKLNSFSARVLDAEGNLLMDKKGKDISSLIFLEGEKLEEYLEEHGGKVTFTVPEGIDSQVQIICTDYAIRSDGTTNTYNEIFEDITVSPNSWIMFYANKTLFYGMIAGFAGVTAAGIGFIFWRKKKRQNAE